MIEIKKLSKGFMTGDPPELQRLFENLDLSIAKGRFVALTGDSGCGKTTLLNMIGGLDEPDSGVIEVAGTQVTGMRASKRARFLNRTIGFVFQFHYLLPELTAIENVLLPQRIGGGNAREGRERARELLEKFELHAEIDKYPSKMSGGQCQRVAIARAMMTKPQLILADEPTASLNQELKEEVMSALVKLKTEFATTVVLVSHERDLLNRRFEAREIDEIIDVKKFNPKRVIAHQGAAA